MPRTRVDLGGPNVDLQPAAAPTASLRPTPRSPLRDLAQGLSVLDDGLKSYIAEKSEKEKADDILKGEHDFYSGKEVDFANATRKGLLPAQYSPAYMKGYKGAQGSVAGAQLASKYDAAYEAWDGKDSEDPKAFDKFYQGFVKDNIGEDADPDVLAGLLPHIRQLQQSATAGYIEDRDKRLRQRSTDAHVAEATQAVDKGIEIGAGSPDGVPYPKVFAAIADAREAYVSSGNDGAVFDKNMTDAMSTKVLATGDEKLLKWFDEKIPGTDYTYGDTAYGSAVKQNTIEALDVISRRKVAEQSAAQTAADKQAKEAAEAGTIDWIIQHPGEAIPDGLLSAGSKVDGTFKFRALEWSNGFSKAATESDPEKIKSVYTDILNGGGMGAVTKAMDAKVFGSGQDLAAAVSFAKSVEETKGKVDDTLSTPMSKNFLTAIKERTKDTNLVNPVDGMSNEGLEATYDYNRKVQEWVAKNPNATSIERDDAVAKIGKSILDNITQKDITGEGGAYNRDDSQFDFNSAVPSDVKPDPVDEAIKPAADTPEQTRDKAAAAGKAVGDLVPPPPEPLSLQDEADIKDFKSGLDDTQMKVIEDRAKREGTTADEVIKKMLGVDPETTKSIPPVGDSKASPISYTPGKEPGFNAATADAILTKALDGQILGPDDKTPFDGQESYGSNVDPGARSILHLIGVHEANGNYNATFGNANSTADLSQYTVNQIIARQLYNTRVLGKGSSAIGKYQFIRKTLTNLRDELGVGNEKFTPELQDRLGMQLLNGRGYQEFRAGKISQKTFALRLSQEWASLPNPNTGRSYYAGDGLNASGTRVRNVYAALGMGGGGTEEPTVQQASFTPGAPVGASVPSAGANDVYSNIPDNDEGGNAGQRAKFAQWNPDPIGNNEKNIQSLKPTLANVIRRAQQHSKGLQFVVGMGKRDAAMQKQAMDWGWSKTMKSDHLDGGAADLWPVVNGKVVFDTTAQKQIVDAMKKSAKELGVTLKFVKGDLPHFGIKEDKTTPT